MKLRAGYEHNGTGDRSSSLDTHANAHANASAIREYRNGYRLGYLFATRGAPLTATPMNESPVRLIVRVLDCAEVVDQHNCGPFVCAGDARSGSYACRHKNARKNAEKTRRRLVVTKRFVRSGAAKTWGDR